jgi:hypothetical protein
MKVDWLRWLTSLVLCGAVIAWTLEGKQNLYLIVFGLMVCAAALYELGYKRDFMRGRRGLFVLFYVFPFIVTALVVGVHFGFGVR